MKHKEVGAYLSNLKKVQEILQSQCYHIPRSHFKYLDTKDLHRLCDEHEIWFLNFWDSYYFFNPRRYDDIFDVMLALEIYGDVFVLVGYLWQIHDWLCTTASTNEFKISALEDPLRFAITFLDSELAMLFILHWQRDNLTIKIVNTREL